MFTVADLKVVIQNLICRCPPAADPTATVGADERRQTKLQQVKFVKSLLELHHKDDTEAKLRLLATVSGNAGKFRYDKIPSEEEFQKEASSAEKRASVLYESGEGAAAQREHYKQLKWG
jgi:hypothetical protein